MKEHIGTYRARVKTGSNRQFICIKMNLFENIVLQFIAMDPIYGGNWTEKRKNCDIDEWGGGS